MTRPLERRSRTATSSAAWKALRTGRRYEVVPSLSFVVLAAAAARTTMGDGQEAAPVKWLSGRNSEWKPSWSANSAWSAIDLASSPR
jgi:hypothetical protein